MPYATNPDDGTRIYYEIEGEGSPIILLHGLTQTNTAWGRTGFVDALKESYRLVLIDARGHGKSDKPQTADEHGGISAMAADTIAVLDTIGIEQAHVLGYSMGALTCYALGHEAPERLRSMIAGGGPSGVSEEWRQGLIEIFRKGPDTYIALLEDSIGPLDPERREEIRQLDMSALIAAASANVVDPIPDDVFRSIPVPCLLFVGERDELAHDHMQRIATLMPNAELHILAGLDHVQAGTDRDRTLPLILDFFARVEATTA
jgi:pimeloyl-ACP methyl ester carboxylesterase